MSLVPAAEHPAAHAAERPDHLAVVMAESGATLTYGELDERSSRLARHLRDRGVGDGGHIAVVLENRPEFFEVVWAGLRSGVYVTPINWHLRAEEAAYIVRDCGADALVVSGALAGAIDQAGGDLDRVPIRLVVGGALAGFDDYEEVLAAEPSAVVDEHEGTWMFYSSGTTGQPKGIKPALVPTPLGAPTPFAAMLVGLFGFGADTVYLSPAPLYHAAPAGWSTTTQRLGGTVVAMERFDPLALLANIERFRVTHLQVVPTHLVRLLKLSDEERARFDLSSLRMVVHAAAPCPVEVKQATIDWLGPIVHEYYAGSEGTGFCYIGPEEWLTHPGSVGRSLLGAIHIVDGDGTELPAGAEGEVWFESAHRFEYHGDPDKTARAFDSRGWSTIGDIGRLDDDGYLYLTDRAANMIISGGVNIYPREIEDVLVVHPAVADVAVLGTPHPDMGEQVTAFVQLLDGAEPREGLDEELITFARDRLSAFKCPRSVVFVDELPRLPSGKLLKRLLLHGVYE